ncbi:MAG: hypothetical protein K0R54_3355 [Clostridiaceae bacterium]|nr:hypothetical protein [Clostridiaceae bacterium]
MAFLTKDFPDSSTPVISVPALIQEYNTFTKTPLSETTGAGTSDTITCPFLTNTCFIISCSNLLFICPYFFN